MTPPGAQCFPKRTSGGRRCLLCFAQRCQRPPPNAVPRVPWRPPAPPLGVSSPPALLRVPARGSLVCSPWRQEEGRGPAAPSSERRAGTQRSRGGRTAAGHVGRTAPQGRLRCAPAAGGPGPHLHREEAARALHDRETPAGPPRLPLGVREWLLPWLGTLHGQWALHPSPLLLWLWEWHLHRSQRLFLPGWRTRGHLPRRPRTLWGVRL